MPFFVFFGIFSWAVPSFAVISTHELYKGLTPSDRPGVMKLAKEMSENFLDHNSALPSVLSLCLEANLANASHECDIGKALTSVVISAREQFEKKYNFQVPRNDRFLTSLLELNSGLGRDEVTERLSAEVVPEWQMLDGTNWEMTALFVWALAWSSELANPETTPFIGILRRYNLMPKLSKMKPNKECVNKDMKVKDEEGHHCTFYQKENVDQCGKFDTDDFIAEELCCDCQERTTSLDERPDFEELARKWRILHDVYQSFDKWVEIWAPQTPRDSMGEANQICRDWLPWVHRFYTKEGPSKDWRCEGSAKQRMADVNGIFSAMNVPLHSASGFLKQTEKADVKTRAKMVTLVKKNIESAQGLPSACRKDEKSTECKEKQTEQELLIKQVVDRQMANGAMDAIDVRSAIYAIWTLRDDVFDYFCETGPSHRLEDLFDKPEGRGVVAKDEAARFHTLPTKDLEMCWKIMETALTTEMPDVPSAYDTARSFFMVFLHWILLLVFVRVCVLYHVSLRALDQRANLCPNLRKLFNRVTFKSLQCTNGNVVGSSCFATCSSRYGENVDGVVRSLHTYCTEDGVWSNPNFFNVCSDLASKPDQFFA